MKVCAAMFLTIFSVLGQVILAQELKPYEGGYTFNDLRGIGKFTYYLTPENEPVLQGPFSFSYKKLDSLTKDNLVKLEAMGNFQSYKKDKSWSYRLEEHKFKVEDVRERQILGQLDSKVTELQSSYDKGLLEGRLNYSEKTWLNEQYLETFRSENLIFRKDKLTGSVLFENFEPSNFYKIKGTLNQEGLMDGAWEFEYLEKGLGMKEIRRYENGFLIGLQKNNEVTGEKIEELVFFNAIEKLDSLNQGFDVEYSISDQFFGLTFNDGFGEQSVEFRQQFNGTRLLEDALIRILQFEKDRFVQNGELVKSPIQTRRFRYELTKEQQDNFKKSMELYGELESLLSLSAGSNFLKLNQNSSDSLAFTVAYIGHAQEKLEKLKPILEVIQSGEINYFDQAFYLESVGKLIPEQDTVRYKFQSEPFEKFLDYSRPEGSKSLSRDLRSYLQTELELFRKFDRYISSQQQAFRQNQDLASIEKVILDRKRNVDSLYTNMEFNSPEHRQLVNAFYTNLAEGQYQELLDTYNQLESFEPKAIQGDLIIDLLRFTSSRMEDLEKVVSLNDQLTKLFTAKTFDPFTFETEFEVIEQRNLYQAAVTLAKYEYKGLLETRDYEVAENHLINLENLMAQLVRLRNSDTRRLERELAKSGGDINQLKRLLSL